MKLLALLFALCVALTTARQHCLIGKIFHFGNNLQHCLLLAKDNYDYYPSITKIHTEKENEDRYVISIHKIRRKEFTSYIKYPNFNIGENYNNDGKRRVLPTTIDEHKKFTGR